MQRRSLTNYPESPYPGINQDLSADLFTPIDVTNYSSFLIYFIDAGLIY